MLALMIADDDYSSRTRLSGLLTEAGYDVFTTHSASHTIEVILKDVAKVLILGGSIDGVSALDLIPVLKKLNSDLKVIIASEELSTPMLRRLREEGIFYYLMKPVGNDDTEEVKSVVECAIRVLLAEGDSRVSAMERNFNPIKSTERR